MRHRETDRIVGRQERRRLAREVLIGAPVAGILWLLLIRLFTGDWSLVFPAIIVGFSIVLAACMVSPDPLGTGAYRFWRGLVGIIDWIITRIVCAFLYYLIFTPLGLILRLLRVPLLSLKLRPPEESCWVDVKEKSAPGKHFFKQY
jgi:hypothetical protein